MKQFTSGLLVGVSILALAGMGCSPTNQPTTPEQTVSTPPATTISTPGQPTATTTAQPTKKPPATKPAPKPVAIPAAHTLYVTITSSAFSPIVIAGAAGDTVVWTNKDTIAHSVTSDNALIYDSGAILPGKSWSHVFKAPGTYGYHSGIKDLMSGTVIVR